MVAVPACDGVGSTLSGSAHIVGSGTAGPATGAAVLVGVGNMVDVSACNGIGSTLSGRAHIEGSGTAGPVGGAVLLTGVGNTGVSGDRGAGDSSTAGDG